MRSSTAAGAGEPVAAKDGTNARERGIAQFRQVAPYMLFALFVGIGIGIALAGPGTGQGELSDGTVESSASPGAQLPAAFSSDYTWQDIGPDLVAADAVNVTRFRMLYDQRGDPLTDGEVSFLTEGSDEPIRITGENKDLFLNVLWALGITNRNPVLEDGRMGQLTAQGDASGLASTGGWVLGSQPGGELLNSAEIIDLTPEQLRRVRTVTERTYRPCCDNHAAFPDCNHGAAALGMAQLLASQGASTAEIEDALKRLNTMWFPQQYRELAIYFEEVEGTAWEDVDAATVLDKEYSSASGWRSVHAELQERDLLPERGEGGSSCGI